jgi:hypothetical protein
MNSNAPESTKKQQLTASYSFSWYVQPVSHFRAAALQWVVETPAVALPAAPGWGWCGV